MNKIKIINYISIISIPMIILIIVLVGIIEKKPIFDLFIKGAIKGIEITLKIFPTLIELFFAIGLLNNSGIIEFVTTLLSPVLKIMRFPKEIVPLVILRPISGSASIAIATNIIEQNGVDSKIGLIASVIMGATETTLYTIAVYTSSIKVKKTRYILIASLLADITGIISAIIICNKFF